MTVSWAIELNIRDSRESEMLGEKLSTELGGEHIEYKTQQQFQLKCFRDLGIKQCRVFWALGCRKNLGGRVAAGTWEVELHGALEMPISVCVQEAG